MNKYLTLLLILIIPTNSFALIEVDITRGNLNPLPIAVSPLSIDQDSKKNFEKILMDDPRAVRVTLGHVECLLDIT